MRAHVLVSACIPFSPNSCLVTLWVDPYSGHDADLLDIWHGALDEGSGEGAITKARGGAQATGHVTLHGQAFQRTYGSYIGPLDDFCGFDPSREENHGTLHKSHDEPGYDFWRDAMEALCLE